MKKLLIAMAALVLFAGTADAGNNHKRHNHHNGNHNNWQNGNNNYYHGGNKNYYYYGNNGGYDYFYQDPDFWGGVAGGIIGGAIINGIQNQPECYWVDAQVFDPSINAYVFRQVQMCN